MSDKNIYACSDLAKYAPQFVENGCNDFVASGLKEDKGLNKSIVGGNHNDCSDLNDVNDCYVGTASAVADGYDDCDWKGYMKDLFAKVYELNKSIIASICGLWKRLHDIEDALDGYTFRVYHTVCSKDNFQKKIISDGVAGGVCYYGQNKSEPGYEIQIPIGTMSSVEAVFAQTLVVAGRTFPSSVTIQSYYKRDNYLIVDLDPYEWVSANYADTDTAPYDLPVDFLVLGKK